MCDTLSENGFPPLSSFRLIVPPLQLVSAALLQIVKQGAVMYFGLLAEFITTVLETAPELLSDTERVQLIIGLRAKAVLELCRSDTFASQQAFQLHLSYITNQNKEASDPVVKASVTNFLRLVHTLKNDQCQKDIFYQYIFPTVFGPKYDSALQALMKKFLFNLQVLLPVPDFEQTSMWLSPSQTVMKECVDLMNQPMPLKTLMRHHRHHGQAVPRESSSTGDDCILSSLSYSLGNEDDNKCDTVVKSEPISDSQEWQTDHFLSSELKQEEEDFGVVCSEFVKKEEEQEQQCVKDLTEDQGASVEVELPSFDKTESNNEEQMDKTGSDCMKAESPTNSGKTNADCSLVCHVCTKVFGSQQSLDIHQRICVTRSDEQETTDTSCSTSSAVFTKPNPADETLNAQDQMCNKTSRAKQCSIWREVFPCSTDFMRHMQCHTQQSSYVCSHCGKDFDRGEDLKTHEEGFPPLSSFRLIVPPLQLVSAALLQIVKQGAVMYFGLLAEFITTVLETAPELLSDTERVQLIIGLRAKAMLELCRSDSFANQQAFQLHLSHITNQDTESIFPRVFGPKYDSALQALMRKFIFNLQELLPVPDFEQTSIWLSLSPSVMKECVDLMKQHLPLETLIKHHKHHGHTVGQESSTSGDYYILSSLSFNLEEDNKSDAVIKSEPICDSQEWQTDNLPSNEPKQEEEENLQDSCSEFVTNEDEQEQQCGEDLTEDQGASVEVTLPSFDETETNDDELLEKEFPHLESGHRTPAKRFCCHVCGKDFASHSKLKKHKIAHSSSVKKSQMDSVSPFEQVKLYPKPRTLSENEALEGETKPSSFENSLPNSKMSKDGCGFVCCGCTNVFSCQKNFDKHQTICAARSGQQETMDSTSPALHTKPNPIDKNKSFPLEMSNPVHQELPPDTKQGKMCNKSNRIKQCSICKEVFPSTDLMRHMQCHTQQTPYLCSPSGEYFESYEDCKTHDKCRGSNQNPKDGLMINENDKSQELTVDSTKTSQIPKTRKNACKPILTCPECGQRFTYCKRFEEHLKRCSEAASKTEEKTSTSYLIINGCDFISVENTVFRCAESISETATTPENEVRSEHKTHNLKCTMCEKRFSKIVLMQKHYSESHCVTGPFPCTLCKTTFARLCELVRHQQNKQLFLCPVCKKGFRTPEEIKRHKNVHKQRATTTVFTCDTCGRSFKFRVNLIMHQRKHRERPPNICSLCGKQFSSRDTLKAHMVRHTDGFPCPECGKIFYQKTLLTYHLYKHKGEEPYLCDKCGKGWPNAALLKVHMVKHREDRPFKCDDCGATYKWESSLISHHRSKHVGVRPFVCEFCSKAFRINSELKKHMMVHSGERPYSCPMCGKKFSKGYNLKKHREKPCQ
ncbi:uncharacterized protein LOC121519979 isoform X2 [Cheilinus undulatus]|uniref:uncharacterized protein LOC121519979 isoform X2 n=1 Tax=Cheilinus undulatus TaxID=241271 RepID=UPI001BD3156A|nr:uncharacterized protein LOC121519979 isoform X2 [Cheilinus undulatus]